MALRPKRPDPFEEEKLEGEQPDPKPGDRIRVLATEFKDAEGYVQKVYKNGHVLGAFRPSEFSVGNRPAMNRGWCRVRLMPGEFEIFNRKIIT